LLIVALFAGSSSITVAQEKKEEEEVSVGIDSTGLAVPVEEEAIEDEETDETNSVPIDTAIVSWVRAVDKDTFASLKKDKKFLYQYTLEKKLRQYTPPKVRELPSMDTPLTGLRLFFLLLQYLLWIGIAVLILFIILKIFGVSGGSFFLRQNRKNIPVTATEAATVVDDPDHYDSPIRKAAAEGNFRLATRYLFLQTLYTLNNQQYIEIEKDKTNYQYITEVRKRSGPISQQLAALVLQYEYIWYGEYEIANTAYARLEESFKRFNQQL
jgi:hypothetical protein